MFADGVLTRVTADDNEAEILLAEGAITAEQARTHPGRHVLTQSIGAHVQPARAQVHHLPAHGGRLLLCTDGLSGEVDDALAAQFLAAGSPAEVAPALVDAALQAGGRDNVTVLVVDL